MQRYQILHRLGRGGFATVYKAKDRMLKNKTVAIKQIDVSMLSLPEMIDATDGYNREVTHLSKLRHEHLPCIYDHFTDGNYWYVVMEYIAGKTLEDICTTSRRSRFSVGRVLDIGIALCRVLSYLHEQRPPIIFRDVKPSNIMVMRTGHLYLIDFGIARHYRPGQIKDTSPLGSPGYAAPEQYGRQSQTTPRTDVYGLGATLQTLLTGKEPLELLMTGAEPTRAIPQQLQTLLTQMLERDVSKRPRNMDEVRQELERLKNRSFAQKMKHLFALICALLKNIVRHIPIILLMLFSLSPLLYLNGFFSSLLWMLYLFIAPSIILGRMALDLHREMAGTSSRLSMEEALAIMGKHFWSSLFYVWIAAWLAGILFYSFTFQIYDHSVLVLGVLACIASCITLIVY